ncbi:response regulator transcription factor [Luteibacter sp. 3190]|uniref:response regulator transcription factor n=1 Tax=Luteibacter sp. 3190 TaxID=2817736 RepID=UPI0028573913|nr:response regulator transcription factor [Luteibacter sp. 3190]MDR6935993.1 DNA-binding NarL/FixJ family response regulator [Luteibacter sp. 3190]
MAAAPPMTHAIRILVVDDHPVYRAGIVALIDSTPDMTVVAEVEDALMGIAAFERTRPDVTLVDLVMPGTDGVGVIKAIRLIDPAARVVVLTTYGGDTQARRALAAGAQAYLLKTTAGNDLAAAIRGVHAGRHHISASVARDLADHPATKVLSEREVSILRGAAAGLENKQIAERLGLSPETIKEHLSHAMSKLHANNRTHAVAIAIERGFLR